MKTKSALILVAASIMKLSATTFTTLDLPAQDTDIRTYMDGSVYSPLFPDTTQTLGGVPFHFKADAAGNTAYIGDYLQIPVGVPGVTTVYTLINTAWGVAGSFAGQISFSGDGLAYTFPLMVGENVRDHFYGGFENNTSDPSTVDAVFGDPNPGHSHLDMQVFSLPSEFSARTLEEVVFQSSGDFPGGRAFLVAVTVAAPGAVPESGATLLLFGIAGVSLWLLKVCSISNTGEQSATA